jgi:hypothetical protein
MWMVDQVDQLFAVWNGRPEGEAWHCINYAGQRSKDIVEASLPLEVLSEARDTELRLLGRHGTAQVPEPTVYLPPPSFGVTPPVQVPPVPNPGVPVAPRHLTATWATQAREIRRRNSLPQADSDSAIEERLRIENARFLQELERTQLAVEASMRRELDTQNVLVPENENGDIFFDTSTDIDDVEPHRIRPPTKEVKVEVRFQPGRVLDLDDD